MGECTSLEKISVLAHVLDGSVVLEGSEFFEFVAPNILFEHDVLVLTEFLHLTQNGRILWFLKLLLCAVITRLQYLVIDEFLLFLLVVVLKTFGSFVESLEEVHHISEPNVDL